MQRFTAVKACPMVGWGSLAAQPSKFPRVHWLPEQSARLEQSKLLSSARRVHHYKGGCEIQRRFSCMRRGLAHTSSPTTVSRGQRRCCTPEAWPDRLLVQDQRLGASQRCAASLTIHMTILFVSCCHVLLLVLSAQAQAEVCSIVIARYVDTAGRPCRLSCQTASPLR